MNRRDFLKIAAIAPMTPLALPRPRRWYPYPYNDEWYSHFAFNGDTQLSATISNSHLRYQIRQFDGLDFDKWWWKTLRHPRALAAARKARLYWGLDASPGWERRCLPLNGEPTVDKEQGELGSVFSNMLLNGYTGTPLQESDPFSEISDVYGHRSYRRHLNLCDYADRPWFGFLREELAKHDVPCY